MSDERWYFTKEQLESSPSRKTGIDADKELAHRQQAASFIRDMGQRLQVTQLCVNTAIVYMHRFYVFHSFTHFHRNAIATAALFLAAKVEEQPRKLEHIIKVAQLCLARTQPSGERRNEVYSEQAQEVVMNENILLQTLGFDVAIEHPHSFIINFCQLANFSKELSQTMYFMATNSLYLTTMCLQYKPTVVACFCVHFVCKWSNREIPKSKEDRSWYSYIDASVTPELMEQLTNEFLVVYDKCPTRLKKKIQSSQESLAGQNFLNNFSFSGDLRKQNANGQSSSASTSTASAAQHHQRTQMETANAAGPSRVQFPDKKSGSTHSSHHPSFHSPGTKMAAGTSSHNGSNGPAVPSTSADSFAPQVIRSSSHAGAPQQAQMSAHAQHKSYQSGPPMHGAVKPKTVPAHHSSGVPAPPKETRHEQRKVEIKQEAPYRPQPQPASTLFPVKSEPGVPLKQEPVYHVKQETGYHSTNAVPPANHHAKNAYRKDNGLHHADANNRFVAAASSHSEIISNVVKEVAMGKLNEKRIAVKTEPPEEDVKPFAAGEPINHIVNSVAKSSAKSHSIFSPSPVGHDSLKSPLEEQRPTPDIEIKQEPPETPSKSRNPRYRESELIPVVKKVETVAGYEDIFEKSTVLVPASNAPPADTKNGIQIKEEPTTIAAPPSTAISQVNVPNHNDEHAAARLKTDAVECASAAHPHKKKKKHKEKDKRHDKEKRHKEKKRHKEDKHHHRKEHAREKELKEPGPIKITIPKEKLVDIPMKLKIKINKDQIVAPSTSEDGAACNDFKLKISKDMLKSRKRERDSDHDHSSKKFAYGGSNSHNGYTG